jgi:hypothetical protein
MSLILQPTSNKDSREHYLNTILNLVSIEKFREFVDPSVFSKILDYYKTNPIAVWGVTRGVRNLNVNKWMRIKAGDSALFYANKKIIASATVTMKFLSKELATELWGQNEHGSTWEYIYLLDEVRFLEIPIEEFNRLMGYKVNYIIQGFNVLENANVLGFIDKYALNSNTVDENVGDEEFLKLAAVESLDTFTLTRQRKEQAYLRSKLFNNKLTGRCGICGKEYSVHFLVASHIKKRALCSLEERLDYRNVVMPMCKFGCDDMFEKGYIFVDKGKVNVNKTDTEAVNIILYQLEGRDCDYWSDSSKKYFDFHKKYHTSV